MAIQAISRVTNRGYSNISFGKRGEKPAKNHNVTSPMKAVPLAVLIAMSPLTTTNAENIMRAESNAHTIELAEAPQSQSRVLMYGDSFKSQNGTDVIVMALNTKGGTDSFDQIVLKVGEFTFEAKDLLLREGYLYSSNGVKEGPLSFKEVIAETEIDGKKERLSFVDPNIVNYVEALVAQPTNKSNIKNIRLADLNMVVANSKGQFIFLTDEDLKNYLENSPLRRTVPGTTGTDFDMFYVEGFEKKRLDSWEKYIQGSHGNYTLRFYDSDGNPNNAESIVLQKDGYDDCGIVGVTLVDGKLHGVDNAISTGVASVIRVSTNPFGGSEEYITDDILANEIVKFYNSPKYNKSQEYPMTINQSESNLALGDY